jgi:hypothetical protein
MWLGNFTINRPPLITRLQITPPSRRRPPKLEVCKVAQIGWFAPDMFYNSCTHARVCDLGTKLE